MVCPTIMRGACSWRAMLGPDLRQVKRRQSKPLDSVGIPLRRVSAQKSVEWLLLNARVSAQDDDVRGFLRCGGSNLQVELGHSLYFPSHWLASVWNEKCHGQCQVVWRLRVNGGGSHAESNVTGIFGVCVC